MKKNNEMNSFVNISINLDSETTLASKCLSTKLIIFPIAFDPAAKKMLINMSFKAAREVILLTR